MKIMLPILFAIIALALGVTGCCANRVEPPQSITFVQAMRDVGQGLAGMKAAEIETCAPTVTCATNTETPTS